MANRRKRSPRGRRRVSSREGRGRHGDSGGRVRPESSGDTGAGPVTHGATHGRHRLSAWMWRGIVYLTLTQWRTIDETYRREDAGVDVKSVATMVFVALTLTLQRYFGRRGFFKRHFADVVAGWPLADFYPHLYWVVGCTLAFFVGPALFVKFVWRERIRDYGWRIRGTWRHAPLYLAMFFVVVPFVVVASSGPAFLKRYPFYHAAGDSWTQLLLWESAYGFQFISLEFFFRGFMLFTLARYIGAFAIFAMVIPYTMIHFAKPLPETLGAVIAGTALGTLSLRTRSILGGILIHVAVAWSMDLLALWRKGAFAHLL